MSTNTGHKAELLVADFLKQQGYKILGLNWKTSYCEIDIIAQRGQVIYFVEVKYRSGSGQGSGLDYIVPTKLRQMAFASQIWTSQAQYSGVFELVAAEVDKTGVVNLVTLDV